MDHPHPGKLALIRTFGSGALIFALLQATRTADLLSGLTRPAVLTVAGWFGGAVSDGGNDLIVGDLRVPWSRDCAGFDVLMVLWGLILWTSRHEPLARRFWLRLIAAVPAAVVANILRVLTIIAWRKAFYPAVESPQTHYFIGFLWLLPLLFFFVPRGGRRVAPWLAGMTMPAAVLSLAAPQASAPGGMLVTACAILLLAVQQFHRLEARWEMAFGGLWLLAAVAVAGAGMESLWLPWLLACPWFVPRSPWLRASAVLLPGTVPLFVMSAPWAFVVLLVAMAGLFVRFHGEIRSEACAGQIPGNPATAALGLLFLVPFVASSLGSVLREDSVPPRGLMARPIEATSWQLHLPFQSPRVHLSWFAPTGSGRHHTLPVCLSYRGRKVVPEPSCSGVFHDDELWLAEAFLMPDGELCDYATYLRRTIVPFSRPGVHLISSARRESLDAPRFAMLSRRYFEQVAAHTRDSRLPNAP